MLMMSAAATRLEATVFGLVQGVYFRQYTLQEARRLGLTGWVANQRDGTVRVVAQGSHEALEQFLQFLQRGSPASQVDKVETNWTTATETFNGFQVRYQ